MIAQRRNEYRTPAILSEGASNAGVPRPCSFESWLETSSQNRLPQQSYP
jgi:hypothetical protein